MRFLKFAFILIFAFNITVCSAQTNKVFCDISFDEKKEVATINVLLDDKGNKMSESDIIVYIKSAVEKCRNDGFENIILTVTDELSDEENIAKLIDGIDVICVVDSTEIKPSSLIGETKIIYITNEINQTSENRNESSEIQKKPNETLNSMVLMSFVLVIIALIVLLAVKKKLKK